MTAEHYLYELIFLFFNVYGLRYHNVNEIKADAHIFICIVHNIQNTYIIVICVRIYIKISKFTNACVRK